MPSRNMPMHVMAALKMTPPRKISPIMNEVDSFEDRCGLAVGTRLIASTSFAGVKVNAEMSESGKVGTRLIASTSFAEKIGAGGLAGGKSLAGCDFETSETNG